MGNRLSCTINDANTMVYQYDKLYQLTGVDYNEPNLTSYFYDKLGNRTKITENTTDTVYDSNALNQYVKVGVTSYSYDKNGNLTDDGYNDYTYDVENRLMTSTIDVLNPELVGPDMVKNGTFTGSANGWTLGSGENGGWYYDNNYVKFGSYETNADMEQTIDGLLANCTYRITYDVLYIYTPYGTSSIGIELGGANATNVTLSTGTQTRYVTTANSTGKLKFKGQTTGFIQIGFDNIKVEMISAANATYKYDYQGRRSGKAVTAVYGSAPAGTVRYCYDGDQIIADYNDSGVLQRKYVYGPGIDEPICMIDVKNGNAMYYYHFDGLGSVAGMSDTSGNIVEKYRYDVYGKPTIRGPSDEVRTVSDVNNRYMFTGREYDSETGLYYYRARYYKPSIGRFLQTDPIGIFRQSQKLIRFTLLARNLRIENLYMYVINNPIMFVDPHGLECKNKEKCYKVGTMYICPDQNSSAECEDCCDYMANNLTKPSWWHPIERCTWWAQRATRIRNCYTGCMENTPIY